MANTRSENSVKIICSSYLQQIVSMLTRLVNRYVFIWVLGKNYLGLNGLFSSILSILTLSELGLGSAITFHLYKPIQEDNKEKIKSLLSLYKKCYLVIGWVIFTLGICLIPWLDKLVNLETDLEVNLYVVYVMYILSSAITYWFFAYYQTFISACQKKYIINIVDVATTILNCLACIVVLKITHSYYFYLALLILTPLLKNIIIKSKTEKMYPFLKEKNVEPIEKKELKTIFKDVYAVFVTKLSSILGNSFDSMIVSGFVSTVTIGLISNYTMILPALTGIVSNFTNAFNAGVGELVAENNKKRVYDVFKQIDLLNFYLLYFVSIGVVILSSPFISLLFGADYVIDISIVYCIVFNNFICGSLFTTWMYRESMGLFRYGKYIQLFAGVANILLSVILCKLIGVIGVYFASFITNLVIAVPPYSYYLYKYGFKKSYLKRWISLILRSVLTFVMCIIIGWLSDKLALTGIADFVVRAIMVLIIPNICFVLIYRKTTEFKELKSRIVGIVHDKLKKRKYNHSFE